MHEGHRAQTGASARQQTGVGLETADTLAPLGC